MTNPPNSEQTVKIWDENGTVMAMLQVGKFPPNKITGIENGAPIWAVLALTLDGDSMQLAQMMQRSETIKRGTGRRQ